MGMMIRLFIFAVTIKAREDGGDQCGHCMQTHQPDKFYRAKFDLIQLSDTNPVMALEIHN